MMLETKRPEYQTTRKKKQKTNILYTWDSSELSNEFNLDNFKMNYGKELKKTSLLASIWKNVLYKADLIKQSPFLHQERVSAAFHQRTDQSWDVIQKNKSFEAKTYFKHQLV